MLEAITKALSKGSIRALIALVFTGVYAYLAIVGHISSDSFEKVCLLIVAFYFGTASKNP